MEKNNWQNARASIVSWSDTLPSSSFSIGAEGSFWVVSDSRATKCLDPQEQKIVVRECKPDGLDALARVTILPAFELEFSSRLGVERV